MSGHTYTHTYTHTHTHTHIHTYTHDNYYNPRCACAPRVNYISFLCGRTSYAAGGLLTLGAHAQRGLQ